MTGADKERKYYMLTEHRTCAEGTKARLAELIDAGMQFAVTPDETGWEISLPMNREHIT